MTAVSRVLETLSSLVVVQFFMHMCEKFMILPYCEILSLRGVLVLVNVDCFHRVRVNASIVMVWEKQSSCTRIGT